MRVLGKIVNVLEDEDVLDDKGKIDVEKLNAFSFDQMNNGYYATGEKVGEAWHSGAEYIKKINCNAYSNYYRRFSFKFNQ